MNGRGVSLSLDEARRPTEISFLVRTALLIDAYVFNRLMCAIVVVEKCFASDEEG